MLTWIAVILICAALGAIVVVFVTHWKEIRLLDPHTIRSEQVRGMRDRIMKSRLNRRLSRTLTPVSRIGTRFSRKVGETYKRLEDKLIDLAGLTDAQSLASNPSDIVARLREVRFLVRDQKWAEAEQKYLEILKLDARNREAYLGLGMLYVATEQFAQAKETFQFLIKIHVADDTVYASLADISDAEHDVATAERMRKIAINKSPRNPIRYAELARHYLQHDAPKRAWMYAERAIELDPERPQFLEISVESAILLADRDAALDRLNRLRAHSTDRVRLQRLADKIDLIRSPL